MRYTFTLVAVSPLVEQVSELVFDIDDEVDKFLLFFDNSLRCTFTSVAVSPLVGQVYELVFEIDDELA